MKTVRRTSLRTIVGQIFTAICALHSLVNIFIRLASGNGFGFLASIVATVSLAGLFVAVQIYHDSEDMAQWPAIAMCLYLISNIFCVFADSWTYLFMVIPLAAMILLIAVFVQWGVLGIVAGTSMIVLNIVSGIIIYYSNMASASMLLLTEGKITSMYIASLLVNNNSLMGIACICFFCTFPNTHTSVGTYGSPKSDNCDLGGFV